MSSRYQDGFIEVRDGLRLHYVEFAGNSPGLPLLCLHGLTRNARDFCEFAQRLSPEFRVIALDFRGRGGSDYDPRPARYTPLTYADDAIELLDQLGIASVILVGTSLGGLVSMILGTTAPERVAGAILNDVGPELDQAGLDQIQSYLGKDLRFSTWDEAAAAISANQGRAFPRWNHAQWLAAAHRNCREQDGEIRFDYDMAVAEPFRTAGPAPKVDLWPFFAALAQKPLLVVRGELSDLLSKETMAKMRAAAPGLHSVTVPGIGHAPMLDEQEAVRAIDAFLAVVAA